MRLVKFQYAKTSFHKTLNNRYKQLHINIHNTFYHIKECKCDQFNTHVLKVSFRIILNDTHDQFNTRFWKSYLKDCKVRYNQININMRKIM